MHDSSIGTYIVGGFFGTVLLVAFAGALGASLGDKIMNARINFYRRTLELLKVDKASAAQFAAEIYADVQSALNDKETAARLSRHPWRHSRSHGSRERLPDDSALRAMALRARDAEYRLAFYESVPLKEGSVREFVEHRAAANDAMRGELLHQAEVLNAERQSLEAWKTREREQLLDDLQAEQRAIAEQKQAAAIQLESLRAEKETFLRRLEQDRVAVQNELREKRDASDAECSRILAAAEKEASAQRAALAAELDRQRLQFAKECDEAGTALDCLVAERTQGFPCLAKAWADFVGLKAEKKAWFLETKPNPAPKAADIVREVKRELVVAEHRARVSAALVEYYETLFPDLAEYREEGASELVNIGVPTDADFGNDEDPARAWLSEQEFANLSEAERSQRALKKYLTRHKSNWEIGRDFERYTGYLFEQDGYVVTYHGIKKGLEDLGRDLICTRYNDVVIVQCKRWSREKTLHEKHVFQLFGSLTTYRLSQSEARVRALLTTTACLSDMARNVASLLDIDVRERCTVSDPRRTLQIRPFVDTSKPAISVGG